MLELLSLGSVVLHHDFYRPTTLLHYFQLEQQEQSLQSLNRNVCRFVVRRDLGGTIDNRGTKAERRSHMLFLCGFVA